MTKVQDAQKKHGWLSLNVGELNLGGDKNGRNLCKLDA